jgi:hypothetical protein
MRNCNAQPIPVARSINLCLLTRIYAIVETDVKLQHFEHLAVYSIAVCKEYRYSVLPSYVKSYLQRMHRVKDRQANIIVERVRS